MGTDIQTTPAQFAEYALGLKLLVRSKVLLRQLGAGNRVGVTKTNFKSPETRRIEIAAALWHLMAEPDEDVIVAIAYGQSRANWLTDMTTVLKGASIAMQREAAVSDGKVVTRFLGRGALKWWVAGGKDKCRPEAPRGRHSLLIISDLDLIPGDQIMEMLAVCAPPAKVLTTTYAHD